jgi:RNA polymerase II subunit A-like phosphatase
LLYENILCHPILFQAAIVDDREDVWANAKNNDTGRPGEPPDNLLLVRPYHWKPFSGYRDVNNASGDDLSKTDDDKANDQEDEDEKDEQLLWIADILKRLHQRFYSPSLSDEERDKLSVPTLLRSMRRETLSHGPQANIVFSGVIPIQQQNVQTKIRLPLIRYAEELGAKILPDVTKAVTHVVAKRDHSDKIKRARADIPGCYIVYPSWLMECYWSITRRGEEPHHMGPLPANLPRQPDKPKDTILLGDSEEEEEEELEDEDENYDGFLDDLETEMLGANESE